MNWLPEFALTASECETIGHANAIPLIRKAAKRVYESDKFANRGEFGELLLHIAIRQAFDSLPAVSKIFYKSANNDTVKGFDAVHVVGPSDDLELWLGEAKFYTEISKAISDVIAELKVHSQTDYLRSEFALIVNKIDPLWPHATVLEKLLQPEISLDTIFSRICIPVLLTYDSDCVQANAVCDKKYEQEFVTEIKKCHLNFAKAGLPKDLRVHLFLMPMQSKKSLAKALDDKLKAWQSI